MTTNRHALSDEKWALVRPFIPKHRGRHGGDERKFIEAVLWIASTGSPWRDLPQELGRWNHVDQRFGYGCSKGHFEAIFKAVQQPDMEEAMIDSTSCKTHQASSGAQKKGSSIDRLLLRRAEHQDSRRRAFDAERHRAGHLAESLFQRMKMFRRVATRDGKLDRMFMGFVLIAGIMKWIH